MPTNIRYQGDATNEDGSPVLGRNVFVGDTEYSPVDPANFGIDPNDPRVVTYEGKTYLPVSLLGQLSAPFQGNSLDILGQLGPSIAAAFFGGPALTSGLESLATGGGFSGFANAFMNPANALDTGGGATNTATSAATDAPWGVNPQPSYPMPAPTPPPPAAVLATAPSFLDQVSSAFPGAAAKGLTAAGLSALLSQIDDPVVRAAVASMGGTLAAPISNTIAGGISNAGDATRNYLSLNPYPMTDTAPASGNTDAQGNTWNEDGSVTMADGTIIPPEQVQYGTFNAGAVGGATAESGGTMGIDTNAGLDQFTNPEPSPEYGGGAAAGGGISQDILDLIEAAGSSTPVPTGAPTDMTVGGGGGGLWDWLTTTGAGGTGGGSGTGADPISRLLASLGIGAGSPLSSGLDLAARLAPGYFALDYARNQPGFDSSKLESLYGDVSNITNPLTSSLMSDYDLRSGERRKDLMTSLTNRGVMGSSFGNMDLSNFDITRDVGRGLLSGQTQLGGIGLQSGLARDILQSQVQERAIRNALYGRGFDIFGRAVAPSNNVFNIGRP